MKTNFYTKQILVMMALFFTYSNVQSQLIPQGPFNPAMVTEENGACLACFGSTWMNTMDAQLADSMYAQTQMSAYSNCFQTTCFYARALMPENFGFSIPLTATITGIKAEVLRKASVSQDIMDTIVQLLKNGLPVGNNKAGILYWTPVASYEEYGDSTDLWGATWTPADINANNFGLFFKPRNKAMFTNFITAFVDHIRITVYYITATGVHEQQQGPATMIYDQSSEKLIIANSAAGILKIYDNNGRVVKEKTFVKEKNNHAVDLRALQNGIYVAQLGDERQHTSLKFVISQR